MTTHEAYQTDALCLKTSNYSDTSKIGTWLSPQQGLIRAIAKGVRGKHRQLAGACLPLAINRIQFKPGRNLDTVTQSHTVLGFEGIQGHLLANGLAFALFAATHALAGHADGETAASLYPPLVEALSAMNTACLQEASDAALLTTTLHGLGDLCDASGHAPEWAYLVDLDVPLPDEIDPIRFSCAMGGVVSPAYAFHHEPPIQLTRQTWVCLSMPTESQITAHAEPAKLLAFYQHFIAHLSEHRQPLPPFDFACQLLTETPAKTAT